MDKESGRKIIAERVEDFERNKSVLTKRGHGETNIRSNFIDVMFQALGWNMKSHYEVVREFSQRDRSLNGGPKKVDYAFKINGKLKFFIEAKEASVHLDTDKIAIHQAKRYAYSSNGKAPIVILTDFEEFRVFNVIKAPLMDNTDRELLKSHTMRYTDYLEKWDLLWDTFAKESVENGSLNRLIGKIDKNTKTMDVDFLEQIMNWREMLARNIAVKNETLSVDEINEAVQRILDRLVFIRNLEDREIEPENTLLDKTKQAENIYQSLIPIFQSLNKTYNGLLFKKHFSEDIHVDDKTIKEIIRQMSYPVSPFQFDVIEPEILGRIYEKFLGSKIRLTDVHRAKIEEKMEVRKAGGVYYTPEYIVEYIVQNTVGKKIAGLTPEQIKQIKIVDPACGSGSFLLGAYSALLEYHRQWYTENQKDKTYQADWYKTKDGEIKVSLHKRGDILRNNIFGVDIDKEATEVAIMSLYLKMLDDGFDLGQRELFFSKGAVLPDMIGNVKCGNSLIDRNALYQNDMFGDDDIRPFDWEKEFQNVFQNGGFDIIVGNPPYIRIQEMQKWAEKEAEIYKKIYESGKSGNFDIYVLFIEKSLHLLNENGLVGMILPNKFYTSDYGQGIRNLINQNVYKIVNFGDQQVFDNATTYTNLLFLNKKQNDEFLYVDVFNLSSFQEKLNSPGNELSNNKNFRSWMIKASSLGDEPWYFFSEEQNTYFDKLLKNKSKLGDISYKLFQGIITGADPVFILEYQEETNDTMILHSKSLNKKIELEKELLKPLLKGKEIRRYSKPLIENYVIFPYLISEGKAIIISKKDMEEKYPLVWNYLLENRSKLENRDISGDKKIWWQFGRNQNIIEMAKPKLITQVLASKASFTADLEGFYYFVGGGNAGGYGVKLEPEYEKWYFYVLGLLNSKPIDKYLQHISTRFRGGFYSYAKRFIEKIPIYIPLEIEKEKYDLAMKISDTVKKILDFKKQKKDADALFLEEKIDQLVYKLYGLTDEE